MASTFGKLVKSIKITADNREYLFDRLFGSYTIPSLFDAELREVLPLDWYLIMPFGEKGTNFWELIKPETYYALIDETDMKKLDNGFYEVRLRY